MNLFSKLLAVTLFLSSFWSLNVHAASFDCNKATTETEKAICADPELSALDELIAKVYFSLDKTGRYFDVVVEDQKDWVLKGILSGKYYTPSPDEVGVY